MSSKKPLNDYARYSSMGLQMAAFITACTFAGKYLDSFGLSRFPVFTITGILAGVFGAMYFMIKQIK